MKVPVHVHIHRVEDGAVRVYDDALFVDDEHDDDGLYPWRDGNYACDCNRAILFARCESEDEVKNLGDPKCSSGRYRVEIARVEDGKVLYTEESA